MQKENKIIAVILCGGFGTRLSEHTKNVPKPMVKLGSTPILIEIFRIYINNGITNFILSTGYKEKVIKNYFKGFKKDGKIFFHKIDGIKISITIKFTGLKTMTGGRIKALSELLRDYKFFLLTYGDGLANVNIKKVIKFHKKNKKLVTITAVRPPARFGLLKINRNKVTYFREKPQSSEGWINGGFFVMELDFLKFISGKGSILEKLPLENAQKRGQLCAFKHYGFWKCMDTKRDKDQLSKMMKFKPWLN